MKKYILIFVIVLILFIIVACLYLSQIRQNKTDKSADQKNGDSVITQDDCLRDLRNLNAKWEYKGNDLDLKPNLVLQPEGKFILNDVIEDAFVKYEGNWTYDPDPGMISLQFDKIDERWQELLASDLYEIFDGVVEYNPQNKEIALKVGYFEQNSEFTVCNNTNYYIDFLGLYLYKTE